MADLLKKDLLVAVPFTKRKFCLIFRLFDSQRLHSLGSISRFFLSKLQEGYDMGSISAAIPFDILSISQRLKQFGFVENGALTEHGRSWAHRLEWHGKPFEVWAYMTPSLKLLLPPDTAILQNDHNLDSCTLCLPLAKDERKNELDESWQNSAQNILEFLSGQSLHTIFDNISKLDYKIREEVFEDTEMGRPEVKYLVLPFPKGTELDNDVKALIKVSMPVLRCETQYSPPKIHSSAENYILHLPPPPPKKICYTHLLDGSHASEADLTDTPPTYFSRWPFSDWKGRLSSFADEQGPAVFSSSCTLGLLWQNRSVPLKETEYILNDVLKKFRYLLL